MLAGSGWKTSAKAAYSSACASPSALASLAPRAVTAVENAGSSPGRPGGHSAHSASSRLRTARPAILRQKLIFSIEAIGLGPSHDNRAVRRERLSFGQAVEFLDRPRRNLHRR